MFLNYNISSTFFPLFLATSSAVDMFSKAFIVAYPTFLGLFVPITFVFISLYPASSSIGLTLPPAINPEPSAPGFNSTLAEPNVPRNSCGIVVPTIGTSIKFFLASSIAFLIASGTSAAFPFPIPTCPFSSPTTTTALNLKFLPPLTTFATLLMATTFSFNSTTSFSRF